jgi:hypothetical protein
MIGTTEGCYLNHDPLPSSESTCRVGTQISMWNLTCLITISMHAESKKSSAKLAKVVVIANESLVEDVAIQQLKNVASLPGVILAVGLPDLHAGPSCPIGAAVASQGILYPSLVGSDIGCGILLAKTSLSSSAACKSRTLDQWAATIQLEDPWGGNYSRTSLTLNNITMYTLS